MGGCNCGSKRASASKTWVHVAPDGKKTSYSSEADARSAAARKGGTVRAA